jgi:hypothetical protein
MGLKDLKRSGLKGPKLDLVFQHTQDLSRNG